MTSLLTEEELKTLHYDEVLKVTNGKITKTLGKGGFAYVYEVAFQSGHIVAMKILDIDHNPKYSSNPNNKEQLLAQSAILDFEARQSLNTKGKYFIKTVALTRLFTYSYAIIMEKAIHGDLNTFIHTYHKGAFYRSQYTYSPQNNIHFSINENVLLFFVKQILSGLKELNRSDYVHLDIKPENILIATQFKVQLADFGLMQKILKGKEMTLHKGTVSYMSPEYYDYDDSICKIKSISYENKTKIDAFALGVTVFKMIFGEYVIDSRKVIDREEICRCVNAANERLDDAEWLSDGIKDFVKGLIKFDIEERMSVVEAYKHPWVNDSKRNAMIGKIAELNESEQLKFFIQLETIDQSIRITPRSGKCFRKINPSLIVLKEFGCSF